MARFWYWTVVHNLTGYSSLEGRIPGLGELSRLLLLIVPASFGLQGISGLFILSSLVYLIPRFGLIHAQVGLALFIYFYSIKGLNCINNIWTNLVVTG